MRKMNRLDFIYATRGQQRPVSIILKDLKLFSHFESKIKEIMSLFSIIT
jgi:ABC-type thiamine transport system ATPase subunit